MTVNAMDTHAVVKQLIAAGFTDEQAEAVTLVVRDAKDMELYNLATKADVAVAKTDLEKGTAALKADVAEVKADLAKSIAAVKSDLSETKGDLEKSIAAVKADLQLGLAVARSDLAETKAEILKSTISAIGARTIVILGAVIVLVRLTAR